MTSDRFRRAREVFLAAAALGDDERDAYVDRMCADDAELRAEVEALLTHDVEPTPVPDTVTTRRGEHAETLPRSVGRYRLLEKIGEGGMGVVYLAEQTQPVRRRVAVKIVKPGMDSAQVMARFEAERQALAVMDHPNVARVFDAGSTEAGRPYFVMDHVAGNAITDYCDRHRLGTVARLELFIQTCEAVQHAHHKGIIHRDLKPSNVLVTVKDGRPLVKVIDFGVAKAISQQLTEQTIYTEQGQLIGTPEYMSPEQAEMRALDIDTRSDIYSLGILLYQLLTGTLPFDARSLRAAGYAEIQRIIREEEPPRPSTRLSSLGEATPAIAHKHASDPRTLLRDLRGDLDWITMRCLEKDRTRRYETANGLVADIRRHLNDQPVVAGPPSTRYRLGKFARRNRAAVLGVAAVFAVLLLGIAGTTWGMLRAVAGEHAATTEAAKATQIADFTQGMLSSIDPKTAGDLDKTLMRMVLDKAADRIGTDLSDQPEVEASIRETVGLSYAAIGEYNAAEPHLERARDLRRSVLGDERPETLHSMNSLAGLYQLQGRYDEAEPLYRRTLEAERRVLGEEHPWTLDSMKDLAVLYESQGRYSEAEPLYVRALETQRRLRGKDHPEALTVAGGLASLFSIQGRYDEAEALYVRVLEAQRRVLSEEHPATLVSMGNLGIVYSHQGRYGESESLLRRTLAGRSRVFGEEHPETLPTMVNLAIVYTKQGRFGAAEPLYSKALEIRRRDLGAEHPSTLSLTGNLAFLYAAQGRLDEAEPLYVRLLETQRRTLGDMHPLTLTSMGNLALLYSGQGRYDEAEPLLRETLELRRRTLGEEHPNTLQTMNGLATLLVRQGRYDEAEPLYLRALDTRRRTLGEKHPHTLLTMSNLAELYKAQGRREPALPLIRSLINRSLELARADGASANTKNDCAWTLLTCEPADLRDPQTALALALAANEMTGHENPGYLDTLSLAYHLTGDTARAVGNQRKAIALLPPGESELRAGLEKALAEFEAALAERATASSP